MSSLFLLLRSRRAGEWLPEISWCKIDMGRGVEDGQTRWLGVERGVSEVDNGRGGVD